MDYPDLPDRPRSVPVEEAVTSIRASEGTSVSTTPGPAVPPPTPAEVSLAAPRVEGLLSKSTTSSITSAVLPIPSLLEAKSAITSTTATPEPDYFSQNVQGQLATNSYLGHQIQTGPRRAETKDYIENARQGLYGQSLTGQSGQSHRHGSDHIPISGSVSLHPDSQHVSRPDRSSTTFPQYPNQSYAALQTQIYPQYHHAPYNSRPGTSSLYYPPASTSILPGYPPREELLRERQTKSNANTPAQTPSLYAHHPISTPAQSIDRSDERSPYPSPYLHPVQLQPPKTVTNARKDVDVFSGRKMINHYEILDELGRGVHGKVKLARDLDSGDQVAIKIVQRYSKKKRLGKPGSAEDKVKKEVAILKKAQHPNVVRMIEVIDDPDVAQVYIVLEFCELKEIAWRTPGKSEILIMENRRLERESHGMPENDPAGDRLMRAAVKRLESARTRPQRGLRTKSASHIWSLEYGGDSDNGEDEGGKVLQGNSEREPIEPKAVPDLPPLTQEFRPTGSRSRAGSDLAPHESDQHMTDSLQHRRPSTSPNSNVTAGREIEYGFLEPRFQSNFGFQWDNWHSPGGVECFGQDRGGRRTSGTGSTSSQITEFMEDEIPEEFRFVPTMTLPECRSAFRDALVGLDYLHYHGIIHRDIKPANLLRTIDHRVKISDFGVSYLGKPIRDGEESAETSGSEAQDFEEEAELAKTVGTPAFYAPELCSLDFSSDMPTVTGQIDVWALGVTLYCLLFGRTPFHAENEFALMRRIADEDVFIPRLRLKAVDLRPTLRSPEFEPILPLTDDRRPPCEFSHDFIDDELYDLLKKLFMKDPKKRITIKEIKYHPWILRDIPNATSWPEETDPARLEQGRKIEISSKEVEDAVIPINFVKRIKSLTNRAGRALGFGGRNGRHRGQSSAGSSDVGSGASAPSTSEPGFGDVRRRSLRGDESILAALKASRDRDLAEHSFHPLSRSVTASPDLEPQQTESAHFLQEASMTQSPADTFTSERPSMPDRQASEVSTTASIRTIRQSDMERGRRVSVMESNEELPETAQTVSEQPASTNLGALFGSTGPSLLKTIRSKEGDGSSQHSPSLSQALQQSLEHPYGGASVAVSNTSVAGHMDLPPSLKEGSSASSPYASPSSSRKGSVAPTSEAISPAVIHSNATPLPMPSPVDRRATPQDSDRRGMPPSGAIAEYVSTNEESTEQQFQHALDVMSRRRVLELEQSRERSNASRNDSRPMSAANQPACPPSPDDDNFSSKSEQNEGKLPQPPRGRYYFNETHPSNSSLSYNVQTNYSTSSDDQLASGLSQSTSYPSVPSVLSADTSLPEMEYSTDPKANDSSGSSEGTINIRQPAAAPQHYDYSSVPMSTADSDDGYAVETDEDDEDSDDDEGFLVMSRRKSLSQGPTRSATISNAQLARRRVRRESPLSQRKTKRSGSTNTMKKIRSHSSGESEKVAKLL